MNKIILQKEIILMDLMDILGRFWVLLRHQVVLLCHFEKIFFKKKARKGPLKVVEGKTCLASVKLSKNKLFDGIHDLHPNQKCLKNKACSTTSQFIIAAAFTV